MNKEQMKILVNIIGGVESGGQIYGNQRYEAYAGKYANNSNEVTCTLGWAQNYGNWKRTRRQSGKQTPQGSRRSWPWIGSRLSGGRARRKRRP